MRVIPALLAVLRDELIRVDCVFKLPGSQVLTSRGKKSARHRVGERDIDAARIVGAQRNGHPSELGSRPRRDREVR